MPDRLLGVPAEELGGVGDLAAGVRQRLAVLAARSARRVRRRGAVISSNARRRISARAHAARWPPRPAAARSAASTAAMRVVDVAVGDRRDHLAGGRVEHVEAPPVGAGTALPPMSRSVAGSGDLVYLAWCRPSGQRRGQYGLAMMRSCAGKRVSTRGPSSVTTTSSSIRAAEKPSDRGAVGLQGEHHSRPGSRPVRACC